MKNIIMASTFAGALLAASVASACYGPSCVAVGVANLNVANSVTAMAGSAAKLKGTGTANTWAGTSSTASNSAGFDGSLNPLGGGAALKTATSAGVTSFGGSITTGNAAGMYGAMGDASSVASGSAWGDIIGRRCNIDASFDLSSFSSSSAWAGVGGGSHGDNASEGFAGVTGGSFNNASAGITPNDDGTIGDTKYAIVEGAAGGQSLTTGTGHLTATYLQGGTAGAEYSASQNEYLFKPIRMFKPIRN